MWIFGYGSLVWKVDFPYTRKLVGYIKGYERRFWQASIDHRGTPEKPGRVVTLVPSSDSQTKVWGAAYKIDEAEEEIVLRHLDHREVMGYEKVPVIFHPIPRHPLNSLNAIDEDILDPTAENIQTPFQVTMYYGSNENEHYIGEAPLDIMAQQIWECVGPSGTNKDYLFNLANSMRQIKQLLPPNYTSDEETLTSVIDSHIVKLESAVIKLNNEASK